MKKIDTRVQVLLHFNQEDIYVYTIWKPIAMVWIS